MSASTMAQRERDGLITHRSLDRNQVVLSFVFWVSSQREMGGGEGGRGTGSVHECAQHVPHTQGTARTTSILAHLLLSQTHTHTLSLSLSLPLPLPLFLWFVVSPTVGILMGNTDS